VPQQQAIRFWRSQICEFGEEAEDRLVEVMDQPPVDRDADGE